jgi:hypothetical protein
MLKTQTARARTAPAVFVAWLTAAGTAASAASPMEGDGSGKTEAGTAFAVKRQ